MRLGEDDIDSKEEKWREVKRKNSRKIVVVVCTHQQSRRSSVVYAYEKGSWNLSPILAVSSNSPNKNKIFETPLIMRPTDKDYNT